MTETLTGVACASALSTLSDTLAAATLVSDEALKQLGRAPDLAVLFVSPHHLEQADEALRAVRARLGGGRLIGCSGEAIVGRGVEVENLPAVALWVATLPDYELLPMHLEFERTADGKAFSGWPDEFGARTPGEGCLFLFGDPFSFPADALAARFNQDEQPLPVLGGMASGGYRPGQIKLFLDDECFDHGAAALYLRGPQPIRTLVSQGCRPIGQPFVVTRSEGHIVHELSGRPALNRLQEVFAELSHPEQQLVRRGLHLGQVMDEYQEKFDRGSFLVRNVIDVDYLRGSIAIGDSVRAGRTVQFHVRDAETADEDLRALLAKETALGNPPPAGALLFSCNGRGSRLFPQPHHDAAAIKESFGDLPLAGFFAQGELGPVGGKSFLHGFTASIALFPSSR